MPLIRYTLIDIVELFNYFTHCVISKHYLFSYTVHENVFTKEPAIIKNVSSYSQFSKHGPIKKTNTDKKKPTQYIICLTTTNGHSKYLHYTFTKRTGNISETLTYILH